MQGRNRGKKDLMVRDFVYLPFSIREAQRVSAHQLSVQIYGGFNISCCSDSGGNIILDSLEVVVFQGHARNAVECG